MPETTEYLLSHKELATALVKALNIHEGIWGLHFRFGISGANVATAPTEISPTALVPILGVGIRRFEEENSIAVDAAKVNPAK